MHVDPIITEVESRVRTQVGLLAGSEAETVAELMLQILRPALKDAAMTIAEQATDEIRAQLPDHQVDLALVEGDPTIRIREPEGTSRTSDEDLAARISLRLPNSLKELIESTAGDSGESVNSWVVRTLEGRAQRRPKGGGRINTTFDL
jgi:hypothetical protein